MQDDPGQETSHIAESGTAEIPDTSDPQHAALLEPHFAAVGKVAVAWACLEMSINMAIWSLAGTSQSQGQCLTAQLTTIQTRARALLSLFRLLGGTEAVAVEVNKFFTKDVDPISQHRNRIVHDPLALDKKTGRVMRIKITADKRLDASLSDDPLNDALKTWEAIKALNAKFKEHRITMFASLPASSRKSSEPQVQTSPVPN